MTGSTNFVSLSTYAFAFAVALSPAVMQESLSCNPATGDATLSALEVEVMGENHISAFDPDQPSYNVWLPLSTDTAIVRAYSSDPDSQVSYNFSKSNLYQGTLETIDSGYFPTGGGELTLDGLLPEGPSVLGIGIRAPGGKKALYTIAIQVGCSDGDDCDDQNECTDDVCSPATGMCSHMPVTDGSYCAEGKGGCYGGLCNFVPVSVTLGSREVVFDWSQDRCEDLDVPDNPARVVRAEDGQLVLFASNAPTSRVSRGADFDSLARICDPPALVSADLRTPESYENWEWIWVAYREGMSVHALISNEFHDVVAPTCQVGDPSPANPCWYNSVTYAVSNDGGRSFSKPGAPAHTVAPPPQIWTPPVTPQPPGFHSLIGYHAPSNIVRGEDGYYYALLLHTPSQYSFNTVMCLMRTGTLDDPASWRAWDGTGFSVHMESPYITSDPVPSCTALPVTTGSASLTYNTYLDRYMVVNQAGCTISLWLSTDLVHWSSAQLIALAQQGGWLGCEMSADVPGLLDPLPVIFPALIDHADSTVNFERPGRIPHLYYTRFNEGHWLDRDLVRVPLKFTMGGPLCEGVECDDQNACTEDVCNGADGSCEHTPIECADSNDCTADICNPAVGCEHTAVANGTACGGGLGICQGGSCSATFSCTEQGIRDAITTGGGPHTFDCATPTTVVTAAEIVIDNNVILDGQGKLTVDANAGHRVLSVAAGATAELIGFTVTGGSTVEAGGGIQNLGTLSLINSVVSGNTARFGGGLRNEGQADVVDTTVSGNNATQAAGGITNRPGATMTLTRCTVQANSAAGNVGGISNTGGTLTVNDTIVSGNEAGGEAGGIRNTDGTLTMTNSTVSDNAAQLSGGGLSNFGYLELNDSDVLRNTSVNGFGGGIVSIEPPSTIVLNNTTVSGNSAHDGGGGIGTSGFATLVGTTVSGNTSVETGGGIANAGFNGVLTVVNSTVSGNVVTNAGGGGIGSSAPMTVISTTISENTTAFGSTGIWNGGSATLRNTIIDGDCQLAAPMDSLGGNVESEGNTCGLDHPTDKVWLPAPELNLQPLGDNGGPTQTHALGAGSVAIDHIPAEDCVDADGAPLTTDQRGLPRPGGAMCDVGAFEVQPAP